MFYVLFCIIRNICVILKADTQVQVNLHLNESGLI